MHISQDLTIARRIRAAGCPLYIARDDSGPCEIPSESLDVCQIGALLENSAFEYSAGTGIMFQLQITTFTSGLAISRFDLELPWQKMGFRWLDDSLEIGSASSLYSFAGRYFEFERKQVLNHRADVCRTLRRGQSLRGFLLGNDLAPIPDEVRNASLFLATVIVWDQFGRSSRAPIELTAIREKKRIRRPSERGDLFNKRDKNIPERVRHRMVLPEETTIERPKVQDPFFEKIYADAVKTIKRKRAQETLVLS
jgi:hypothetical protein